PTFTLFVGGSNIVNGAAVAWNGELRPTVNVNCNAIAATIPASDIAATGQNISTATISVVDPASGMPYVPDWGTATFLFTIVSSDVTAAYSSIAEPGGSTSAGVEPPSSGQGGVTATLDNSSCAQAVTL